MPAHMCEKLNSLGMAASGIAHELNGPLATVKACSEGLLRRLEKKKFDPDLFKNYLEIIEEEVERCVFITGNILRYLRGSDEARDHVVDIHASLEKTINMVNLLGRCEKIQIIRKYEKRKLLIFGNEGEFRQAFLSIIVNALDVMHDGGRLTLKTETDNHSILISFNNTGDPIPQDFIGNIFDPYFTTKANRGGTGLGLFLASNIITERGGKISVHSDKEEGTTFTITLPS